MSNLEPQNYRHRALNSCYELGGNLSSRQISHWWRCKTSIMGNYHGDPKFASIIKLVFMHKVGPLYYWFNMKVGQPNVWIARLKQALRKFTHR